VHGQVDLRGGSLAHRLELVAADVVEQSVVVVEVPAEPDLEDARMESVGGLLAVELPGQRPGQQEDR